MVNLTVLAGRIGQIGELREVGGNRKVVNIRVAINIKKQAHWFDVAAWGNIAEYVVNHASKGDIIFVIGNLLTQTYTKKDGSKVTNTYISATSLKIIDTKAVTDDADVDEPVDDDIPF